MKLSDEFLLAAACCRWPPGPEREVAVRAASTRPVDWQRFLRIVGRQRVAGLVGDALDRAKAKVPTQIAARLRRDAQDVASRNLAFAAETIRIQRLFEGAGLTFLFVKGATLDILAYGTLGLKKARDIDLLIAPEDVERACALLHEAGYVRTIPGPEIGPERFADWVRLCKETNWTHPKNGIILELHTGLVDNPALLADVGVRSPRQFVEVAPGARLPTLARDELFAYLCVHGATHAWSRMKWIADVAALLKRLDPPELELVYRRSLELGVGRCSAQALLLCETLFGLELPSHLAAELRTDRATRLLAHVALGTMAGRHCETELDDTVFGTVPIHLSHFLLARGWRYKASEVGRKALSHQDRTAIPLPRPLHFLYPLLAVPSWLWRRMRGPKPV